MRRLCRGAFLFNMHLKIFTAECNFAKMPLFLNKNKGKLSLYIARSLHKKDVLCLLFTKK